MHATLTENIHWIGIIDWNLRDFHGYITKRGATYNSYLITDEKTILVDTVKKPFFEQWLANIREIVDPATIDYLICNHIEPDHSGSLNLFRHMYPQVKILASKMAVNGLKRYYGPDLEITVVKSGETLSAGANTLQFLETPMVHWPDSMFTYIPEKRLLFSMDAFGQHIATARRFDDQVDLPAVMQEAKKYYANLLIHLSPLIQTTLKKVTELKLEIDMIAPSHGIIWRSHISDIMQAYTNWSTYASVPKAVIIYDTMWGSTELMAQCLVNQFMQADIDARLLKLRENHRSDVMAEILDARAILIGSPTIHRQMFPTVADLLCYMKGLKPQHKIAAAFGSYGWSGEAMQLVSDELQAMQLDVIDGIKAVYRPAEAEQEQAQRLVTDIIARMQG